MKMDKKIRRLLIIHEGDGQVLEQQGEILAEVHYELREWQGYATIPSRGSTELREDRRECDGTLTIREGRVPWEKGPFRLRTADGRETSILLKHSTRRCRQTYSRTNCPIVWSDSSASEEETADRTGRAANPPDCAELS
jgi:hypothetical protein